MEYEVFKDHNLTLEAVLRDGAVLQFASEKARANSEVVLAAVRVCGQALAYASDELCGRRDIVCAAVHQDGHALCFASEELRADRDVVQVAVKRKGSALCFAGAALRADRELVLMAVHHEGEAVLPHVCDELRNDRDVLLVAIQHEASAFRSAPEHLRADREFVTEAVRANAKILEWVPVTMQNDEELVRQAFKVDPNCVKNWVEARLWQLKSAKNQDALVRCLMLAEAIFGTEGPHGPTPSGTTDGPNGIVVARRMLKRVDAQEALQATVKSQDIKALTAAIVEGKAAGVKETDLQEAATVLARVTAR